MFGLTAFATAQTATGNASTTTGAVSSTAKNKKSKGKAARPSERLNNRRNYHFKNGQTSTPTGNEATPVGGGGYAALGKNEATNSKSDTVKTRAKRKQ